VRSFSPDPVEKELTDQLLAAATQAPSSFNEQPWRFYVTQGETRQQLGEIMAQSTSYLEEYIEVLGPEQYEHALRWYNCMGDAPILIAVTVNIPLGELQLINRYLAAGAAIENLLLAATAVGLATCNVTFAFMVKEDIEHALGVPSDETLVSIIALGHPTDEPPAAPPHDADVVEYLD
jgi:nitroreductase